MTIGKSFDVHYLFDRERNKIALVISQAIDFWSKYFPFINKDKY